MLNKVQLIGNLGNTPELRVTAAGHNVTTFSLATDRRWKDRQGNRQEATDWHQVVCWGRRAALAVNYLAKGSRVYIEGRLQTSSWEDEEAGITRYRTEIVCQNLQMLNRANAGSEKGSSGRSAGGEEPQGESDEVPAEDNIPF